MATKTQRLKEIRRRLGPYTALQGTEPFRVNDAELARRLVEVIELLLEIVEDEEPTRKPPELAFDLDSVFGGGAKGRW